MVVALGMRKLPDIRDYGGIAAKLSVLRHTISSTRCSDNRQCRRIFGEMTNSYDWAADQAGRIAATVRLLRGNRSGQWLSDATAEAGHRIARTTLSEIESGKRKSVTTAELCVLAWALNVPPVRLMFPDLPDGPVQIVPGVEVPSIQAVEWFSGEIPQSDVDPATGVDGAADRRPTTRLVELARRRNQLQMQWQALAHLIALSQDEESASAIRFQIVTVQSQVTGLNNEMSGIDGAVVIDGG